MKKPSQQAQASKAIRAELKTNFPETKFQVRGFSGSAVKVEWTAGPEYSAVESITAKFASFQGLRSFDDYAEFEHNDSIPQVDYVMTQRRAAA